MKAPRGQGGRCSLGSCFPLMPAALGGGGGQRCPAPSALPAPSRGHRAAAAAVGRPPGTARRKGGSGQRGQGAEGCSARRQLCHSRLCWLLGVIPAAQLQLPSGTGGTAPGSLHLGFVFAEAGDRACGLSESGRGTANLSVLSPWDSCPQAGAFLCHSEGWEPSVAAGLPCALLLHNVLPLAQMQSFGCRQDPSLAGTI